MKRRIKGRKYDDGFDELVSSFIIGIVLKTAKNKGKRKKRLGEMEEKRMIVVMNSFPFSSFVLPAIQESKEEEKRRNRRKREGKHDNGFD